jgi:hypothetical protein
MAGRPGGALPSGWWRVLRTLCVALAALGLWAAPAPVPASPLQPAHRLELAPAVALSHRAERLKAAFRSGDPGALRSAVLEVELLRRTYGTLDVLPLVEAMAIFAREMGDENRPEVGLEVVRTMERWAPKYPTLLGTRVILQRQQGLMGAVWSMADVLELTRIRLTHPVHRWLWLVQHIAWLRLMATLLLWGWAATMALRYRRVFRYLWEEPLARRGLSPHVMALLGAFLITLPVIVGLDPNLVAMMWLILLAPFLLPLEIRATLLVIALQLVHPALALLEPMAAKHPEPSIVTLQMRPQPIPEDDKAFAGLPAGDRAFLSGWRQLQFQNWSRAEAIFLSLARTHADHAEVMNNLGVARFELGNLPGAQACFDEACKASPTSVEVLVNQSVVAFKTMDSPLGSSKQEDARRVAPEAFNHLLAANQVGNDQRTFPMPLPDSPGRIQALLASMGGGQVVVRAGVKENVILVNLVLPILALGLFLLRLRKSINESHPSQCTRCGDAFHTTDSPDVFVCSKCHHLFTLKDGLHGESRKKKVDGVARFQTSQRWLHRTLMVVLPGADRCFIGDTRHGFVEYVFLCFALGIVLATGRSVRYPGEILADPASAWLPLGLGLLAVLFVRSWFKLLPRRF